MNNSVNFIHLQGQKSSLVLDCRQSLPSFVYWGKRLNDSIVLESLTALSHRQEAPSSSTKEVALSLTPTLGQGFSGHPGLTISGVQDEWGTLPLLTQIENPSAHKATLTSLDPHRQVQLVHEITLDNETDVLGIQTKIKNTSKNTINVGWCAAATLQLPTHCDQLIAFEGAWAKEFQLQHHPLQSGIYMRENRKGRTSHDSFPGIIVHDKTTNEYQGEAYGFHLGWSGNHRVLVNQLGDGRRYAQLGELLLPGEIMLSSAEEYTSPTLYASFSNNGFSALSRQFHQYVRQHLMTQEVKEKPRPVHYNTWEGLYFDHDVATLKRLVERAQSIGVERFVLDDGWFIGRNDDKAGLGDWFVDEAVYPQGLSPVIDKVNELGMEFGLWFEPEMINPDSNLYREHPEWALSIPHNPQLPFRNQLVLDLTQEVVRDYLFTCIDDLLCQYNIAYIKWDMNRDLNHPGNDLAKPAVHQQTHAVYTLIKKLKDKHPHVEIESCASGGARADYGVLQHTDRIWTSDSNDALERLSIQKGFSFFFPPELMGSHVGPRDCHITHRRLSMATRAAVTLFGHMGMEMDLRELTDLEIHELKAMVNLYKKHRSLLHSGFLQRLETPEHMQGFGVISEEKSEALYAYHMMKVHHTSLPGRFKLHGLATDKNYRLNIVWPIASDNRWEDISVFNFPNILTGIDDQVFSGQALCDFGIEMPLLTPQSALVFHLNAV